ncbi:MAG: glutaredoxin family protein, partial [Caldilinea sp.]
MKRRLLSILLVALFWGSAVQASPAWQEMEPVVLYFFWGEGCPHCAAAKPFLVELEQRYPSLTVRAYEVWNHEANRALFVQIAARHGVEPTAVPVFFVGNRHWIGYAEAISALEIERAVGECVRAACPDADSGGVASAEFSPARRDPSASSPPAAGRLTVP